MYNIKKKWNVVYLSHIENLRNNSCGCRLQKKE